MKTKAEIRELIATARSWSAPTHDVVTDLADALEQALQAMPAPEYQFDSDSRTILRPFPKVGSTWEAIIRGNGAGKEYSLLAIGDRSNLAFDRTRQQLVVPIGDCVAGVEPEPDEYLTNTEIEILWRQKEAQALRLPDAIDFARAVISADRAKRNGP